ncbi:MAG: hypothetical protein ACUVQ9_00050 [Thermodesulfobacteriota bacterium]
MKRLFFLKGIVKKLRLYMSPFEGFETLPSQSLNDFFRGLMELV